MLCNLAVYALALDDIEEAERNAEEAMRLARIMGATHSTMCALQHLGSVAARRGEYDRAARLLGASDERYRKLGIDREFTEKSVYDQALHQTEEALGAERLRALLAQGAALPVERAVEFALQPTA